MASEHAIFLDRDGVLSRNVFYPDTRAYEGPRTLADLELYPGAIPALKALRSAGYSLYIVSNQPNYAKGKSSFEQLDAIHTALIAQLSSARIEIVESFYCFHHPGSIFPELVDCDCRKPSPRFLFSAAAKYGLDLSECWMVGDRKTDVECGFQAGVRTIRIQPSHPTAAIDDGPPKPDFVAADLLAAAEIILRER